MPTNVGKKSILVSIDTKERLTKIGLKNESYDDIIRMLLDSYDDTEKIIQPFAQAVVNNVHFQNLPPAPEGDEDSD